MKQRALKAQEMSTAYADPRELERYREESRMKDLEISKLEGIVGEMRQMAMEKDRELED